MVTDILNRKKSTPSPWILLLSLLFTTTLTIPTADAHGTSSGSESGGLALMIFPIAAVLFGLFLVFMHRKKGWTILVTGGGGYIGSVLVPKLLKHGHRVIVLDLFQYGDDIFEEYKDYENFRQISGDFRDPLTLANTLQGCDAIIHLACATGRTSHHTRTTIEMVNNLAGFRTLLETAKTAGIKRFIFASSLRKKQFDVLPDATNQVPLDETDEFLLDKEKCEHLLKEASSPKFIVCTIRSAFICGVAPSQRIDYGVNAYAWEAFNKGEIKIIGSDKQKIANIHVDDLADIYLNVLNQPDSKINRKIYNANSENLSRFEIATTVAAALDNNVVLNIEPNTDYRPEWLDQEANYEFEFKSKHTVNDAISDLLASFKNATISTSSDNHQHSAEEKIRLESRS